MTSPTSSIFTCKYGSSPLLGESNYTEWATHMRVLLIGADVFDIVNGSEPPPAAPTTTTETRRRPGPRPRLHDVPDVSRLTLQEPTSQELRAYNKRRNLAISLIWSSLSSTAKGLVTKELEDPQRMWTILMERKNTALNDVAAANIREQFNLEKWKNSVDTLSSWYSRLLGYQDRLTGTRGEVRDWDIAMKLLNGLPPHWDTAKHQIMGMYPQLELGNVISALESRAELVSPPTATSSSGSGNTEALISTPGLKEKPYQRNGNGNGRRNYRGRQRYNNNRKHDNDDKVSKKRAVSCYYCGRRGHIEQECHFKINGEKARKGKGERQRNHDADVAIAAVDEFPRYATALVTAETADDNERRQPSWYIDSGAGAHITYTEDDFDEGSLRCFSTPRSVKVGDGRYVKSNCLGTVSLPGIVLQMVWLVPRMKFRLVSQFRLGKEGMRVILDDGTGEIVNRRTGDLLAKTALISHPTLQELVLKDNDATCAIVENTRALEPIDPDDDVVMQRAEQVNPATDPTSDLRPEYQASAKPPATANMQPLLTGIPIPLLP
jgi:hypothetical protein